MIAITIGKNVVFVGTGVFSGCTNLSSITVADGSDSISLCARGGTSVLIKNILSAKNSNAVNVSNADTEIYARVYVQLADGTYVYSKVVQVTLQQAVTAAQNNWEALSTVQKDTMKQMYTAFEDTMQGWDVPNLKKGLLQPLYFFIEIIDLLW